MAAGQNWTIEEIRHALALYLRTPFGRIHKLNPDIVILASKLGRTPSAISLKMSNLAAVDDTLPQKGMSNTSKLDKIVWEEFLTDPSYVEAAFEKQTNTQINIGFAESKSEFDGKLGISHKKEVMVRSNQGLFREAILTAYQNRCALTGIDDKRLLNASHIVAWKDDPTNRLNPRNGICLNALHDRAFDRHLITFDEDYTLLYSDTLSQKVREKLHISSSSKLELPTRFLPDQNLLEAHRAKFLQLAR